MPSVKTAEKAIDALDGMRVIVKNEMLAHEGYITNNIVNQELAEKGALCGGRHVCAIGALWLGYGIQPEVRVHRWEDGDIETSVKLPGVEEQRDFVSHRPALKLAVETVSQVAQELADKRGLPLECVSGEYAIEKLFEGYFGDNADYIEGRYDNNDQWTDDEVEPVYTEDLLKVITTAKRRLKKLVA